MLYIIAKKVYHSNMITPQTTNEKLAQKIGLKSLYLKREDLHPLRSHKGRSLPKMIDKYAKAGFSEFAISSSGNAGIAAAMYINQRNRDQAGQNATALRLKVFVGEKIPDEKRRLLTEQANSNVMIIQRERPLQAFLQAKKDPKVKGLRQSTDDSALEGYADLARELSQIAGLSAIFVPTSSGACAQGIYAGYKKAGKVAPEIHIVQTQSCHPMVEKGGRGLIAKISRIVSPKMQTSIADAIVDQIGHRKVAVTEALRETRGSGWVASNDDLIRAVELLRESNVLVSPNGALTIAGLTQAIKAGKNKNWQGPVVCLIGGK